MKATLMFQSIAKRMTTCLSKKVTCLKQTGRMVARHYAARAAVSANTTCAPKAPCPMGTVKAVYVNSSINTANCADASLIKDSIRLTEAYAEAVAQRNEDAAATNAATNRELAARLNKPVKAHPASGLDDTPIKPYTQRQQIARENQKTLDLQEQLKELNATNKLAEAKARAIHNNTRILQKECEEQSRRHRDISQDLYAILNAYDQAMAERNKLSQEFYSLK
ncbi:hypothetical protein LPJ78_000683 [Coemansia sp. RSA 989]|nr:hypothetical protein LPJ68_000342 [Coemansia sp. RSA 1086]KAJ1867811.1 hypothetical protein LPJ78_000683 [Coemansia sp. RSA 989]KAJ1874701.1 hypothetical protein LPJ55_001308 [Coemansia sp. RSA 990]KAJ2673692.1 hypothetical protein IWW42_002104 [Coemansia sp. RSA 1085]